MSINFDKPVNSEALAKIVETFGEPVAKDKKTFLYNNIETIEQRLMKQIANAAKQPAIVELNGVGSRKTMEDGTEYEVTENGWIQRDPVLTQTLGELWTRKRKNDSTA